MGLQNATSFGCSAPLCGSLLMNVSPSKIPGSCAQSSRIALTIRDKEPTKRTLYGPISAWVPSGKNNPVPRSLAWATAGEPDTRFRSCPCSYVAVWSLCWIISKVIESTFILVDTPKVGVTIFVDKCHLTWGNHNSGGLMLDYRRTLDLVSGLET